MKRGISNHQSGVDNLDSGVGIFAPDAESYRIFRPLFHPIVCSVHSATPETRQPDPDWTDPDHLICEGLGQVEQVSIF
jgi:hypothetical protein